jgi:hypothetical protein
MTSSQGSRVNKGDPSAFAQTTGPEKSHQGKKMFIRELNKTIVGNQVGEFTGHIPANMEQIVMFEVSVTHYMKIDYNGHNLAITQFARLDSFSRAVAQLMCLQLFDK